MGQVFREKERYVVNQCDRLALQLKLVEEFLFDVEAIPNFASGLAMSSFWEGPDIEQDYSEVISAYLKEMWPEFEGDMQKISAALSSNRSRTAEVESLIYGYVECWLDDLVILWALSQPSFERYRPDQLLAAVALTNSFGKAAQFSPCGDPMDFGRWVLDDWLGPHLRFFNHILEGEKEKGSRASNAVGDDDNMERAI
jgi:hypothetical protein